MVTRSWGQEGSRCGYKMARDEESLWQQKWSVFLLYPYQDSGCGTVLQFLRYYQWGRNNFKMPNPRPNPIKHHTRGWEHRIWTSFGRFPGTGSRERLLHPNHVPQARSSSPTLHVPADSIPASLPEILLSLRGQSGGLPQTLSCTFQHLVLPRFPQSATPTATVWEFC